MMYRFFFRERHTGTSQEIEKLRRSCCEETNRARQLRIDDLSMQQEKGSYDCEAILVSNSGFRKQCEFFVRGEGFFTILRQRTALEHPTFLLNP